jgi:hypothetical protein
LRAFLLWCADRGLDPLAASRVHLELYIRWMQEVRRFKPVEVEPEVRSWLERLSDRDFGRADFLVGLLAEQTDTLAEP